MILGGGRPEWREIGRGEDDGTQNAVVQMQDTIGQRQAGGTVRDQDHRALAQCLVAFGDELALTGRIEHRGGFVQHQNRRIFQQCTRQRDALLLASG